MRKTTQRAFGTTLVALLPFLAVASVRIDLSFDQSRQTVIAEGGLRLPEGYQGHPTTVLTREGKLICVWTFGHGGPCGPAAESSDGGRTWTRIDGRFPAVYAATHKNCPTLQKCVRKDGGERLFVFSAKFKNDPNPRTYYTRLGIMISDDGGRSWREGAVADVSAGMPPTGFMQLKDGSLALFGQVRNDPALNDRDRATDDQSIWMSVSTDDGETWSAMRVLATLPERNLCEPCCLRSPDGTELALLLRENRHRDCSMLCFSSDEGKTWTKPVLTAPELSGDRHEAVAFGDGRYLICFRDMMKGSPTFGQFVGWVGTWQDLKNTRPGAYRIRLLNHHGIPNVWPGNPWDTGYSGVELLPNGEILCTTYTKHYEGPRHSSVVCTRFRPEELPTRAKGTPVSEVLDFGPDGVAGYPEITVTGVTGPARVRVAYATHPDGLGEKGDFWHESRANYMGDALWLPILPANTDRFDVFEVTSNGTYRATLLQGLVRYVRVKVETGAVIVTNVRFVNDGVYSTEKQVGSFACSDARVNAVWDASVRTCQLAAIPARTRPLTVQGAHTNATLGTTYAYLSDGAKRDRLVWSGDLWFAQRNMYAAFDVKSPFMPGSIRMLGENRTPDGYVQACPFPESHGPLREGDYGPFASDEFAAWFIPVLRDHVLYSGDLKLAREQFRNVRDLVDYLVRHTGVDGIFEQRLATCKHSCGLAVGGTSLHHRSYMNILNWKAYADAVSLADWLGEGEDAKRWRLLAERTAKAIRATFWNAEKGHFVLSREERVWGFEANALALATRFATEVEAKCILPQLMRCWHGKFQALAVRGAFEYGAAEKAMELVAAHNWYKYLDPGWNGTHTVQECANLCTKGWGDEAHPDACLAGVFTNYLLGIEPLEPGYKTFRVRPRPTKTVTQARGRVSTPYGMLEVEWCLKAGKTDLIVRNPAGTRRVD